MKWNRNRSLILAGLILAAGVGARADLSRWIQDIASPNPLEAVFFRSMPLPGGPVNMRRPPKETRAELQKLIAVSPSQADLYALRAHEDEMQLDFAAAESDWKKYVELASDKAAANLELADYYYRRLQPKEEIAALEFVGRMPSPASDKLRPPERQRSWMAFERMQSVISAQALPFDMAVAAYRARIARYPAEPAAYKTFFEALAAQKRPAEAEQVLADYRRAFPADEVFPVQAAATLSPNPAQVYDRNFRPLWPTELVKSYFDVLKQTHALRRFLDQARTQVAAQPAGIEPAARLYYYQQQQGNAAGALRALHEYRRRKDRSKTPWTADELWTLGQLFAGAHDYDEAARSYTALYTQAGGNNQERALSAIAELLLVAPDQPIRFGMGGLSLYRDIATMDPGPGYLNGVLSLLFNSTAPQAQFATENRASLSYFHRAKASELISEIDRRFPKSAQRAELHAKLILAYVTYGDDAGVLRAGAQFIREFPKAPASITVALAMADSYARQGKTKEEFALYDEVLRDLAASADHVPVGDLPAPQAPDPQGNAQTPAPARSPEYVRVLDRYVGRLAAMKRLKDALAIYRREIDRNPNDPGLYERLAGFLDQNKMGAEVEQVYRKAMAQFQEPSWSHKLARWYLRHKQTAQFDALTREVVKIFSGTELEAYLNDAGQPPALAAGLYRQVNLYAHQRYPYDLTFVRNLLNAYSAKGAADPAAREALLRANWYHAPDLRDRFFEMLSRNGKLKTELAAISTPDASTNPAAAQFVAEAEAWQSHFERAAPLFRAVALEYPGDVDRQKRAASMYRSLATYDRPGDFKNTGLAVALAENASMAQPRDGGQLASVGELYADRERFTRAAPWWNRIAAIEPGIPAGYLDAATVFWDYYRFDDALRLIDEGRKRLNKSRLYSYEAGAIYENRRDYGRAIQEYATGALATPEDPSSRARLVQLSTRPAQRAQIDALTAQAAASQSASVSAVSLRLDVLAAQNRTEDLRQFLLAKANSTSLEVLDYVEQNASTRALDDIGEQVKLRRITLTTDPVDRMAAQIALVHSYESRKNIAAANRVIEDLYRTNPAILGVVRAAVDFYWRNKDSKRAIDTLVQAAAKAQPEYRDPFTLEAARKATDAGDTSRARTLLASLLQAAPFRSDYVAAMADTFARQNDDTGLRAFYNDRLKAIQQAPFSAAEKTEQSSAMRRGLIPVLTRMKDYQGALDQYVELLNRYPEDRDLAREVAAYASAHQRAAWLVAYYQNTQKQSPRDYRWPMVEARLQTQLEDFPAAVAAYKRAAETRPDRTEFYSERAGLEERLLRFDEAAATYQSLYELTYHNSQWMERVAAVRARQGRADDAVKALDTALIAGRPPTAEALFSAAQRLENWNMLAPAREYAEKAVQLAGADLITDYNSGAQTYVRILSRLRQYDSAYRKVAALSAGKPVDPALLQAMGLVVAQYFTPEQKSAFAAFAGARLGPAVQTARLLDLDAKAAAKDPDRLVQLQQRRMQFGDLAAQLLAYWKTRPADEENRDSFLVMAAQNYKLAGDAAGESRALMLLYQRGKLEGELLDRVAAQFARTPEWQKLINAANGPDNVRDALANYSLRNGTADEALQAIAARGEGMPPIWTRAYTGLTGLYFAANRPAVNAAFREALGPETIGERLGKQVDRTQQLAGDPWFYYGARYGEYLGITKQGEAEDYLPSAVEARPGSAEAYFQLGEYYRQNAQPARAREEYGRVLQLDPNRADVHDRMGAILAQQGKQDEAMAEFRLAFDALARQQDLRHMPESFWTVLAATLEDAGRAHLLDRLRDSAGRLLRTYLRRNSQFRAEPLLEAAIRASGGPVPGVAWVVELGRAAPDPVQFFAAIVGAEWIPETERAQVYRAMIDMARLKPELESDLRRYQFDFIAYLVDHARAKDAQAVLADIPLAGRKAQASQVVRLEIRIAAQTNTLPALLNRYSSDPDIPNNWEQILAAASELEKAGQHAAARQVSEFVYVRQLEARQPGAGTFTGLAEIRLEQGDAPAAIALLKRMTMVIGEPFQNLSSAADLLLRTGHAKEALPFLEQRVKAVPWDFEARVQLAKAQAAADELKSLAVLNEAPYETRVAAARALRELKAGPLAGTSAELVLLSSASITPASAEKPYFYHARLDAAAQTADTAVRIRLLRGAIAIDPARERTKLDLIRAALDARRWQLAIAAASFPPLDFSGHADLARGLGQAYEALHDWTQAESLYKSAGDERDFKRVRSLIGLQAENERRRPVVSSNLEQDRLVQPRLLSANAANGAKP